MAQSPIHRPTTFRLPQRGGDQYFGITKAAYYLLEKRGLVRLVRIVQPGKSRGITLVDYASAEAYVAGEMNKAVPA